MRPVLPGFLRLSILALLALAALPTHADDTAYNQGVQAFRVKDYAAARKLWAQSITDGGPDEAFNNLAFLIFTGRGGEADAARAVALWRKGAALSVSESQWHLGQAYERGTGVAQDRVQALAWYLCAQATAQRAIASDPTEAAIEKNARDSEGELSADLNDTEVDEAQRLAQQLIARYSRRLLDLKP